MYKRQAEWRTLIARYHAFLDAELGQALPQTPFEQLLRVVEASFQSWRSPVARTFRAAHGISENAGIAVTVHAMIFNERGEKSGTGHALSRDMTTGKSRLTGEFRIGGREDAGEIGGKGADIVQLGTCLLYTSPSPRD